MFLTATFTKNNEDFSYVIGEIRRSKYNRTWKATPYYNEILQFAKKHDVTPSKDKKRVELILKEGKAALKENKTTILNWPGQKAS